MAGGPGAGDGHRLFLEPFRPGVHAPLWKVDPLIVVGVTGGLGTGKSTVARMFERFGAKVLDADRIAHELMRPRRPVWRKIRARFGEAVLKPSGEIDRKALGKLTFNSPRRLGALCDIVHPAVRRRIRQRLREIRRRDPEAVAVLDVPLLIEAETAYRLDFLVVVSAPSRAVARRLKARSGWDANEIRKRRRFQMPLRRKERAADFVVRNQGSLAATRRQAAALWKRILHKPL